MVNKIVVSSPRKFFLSKSFANISWMLADKVGSMGLSFVVGVFVARYLGPGEYGLLGYAQSIAVFFSVIAGMGLEGILKRNLVNEEHRLETIMGTALAVRLSGAVLSLLLFGLFALVTGESQESFGITLIIMLGTVFQSFSIIEIYFQSKMQSRLPAIIKLGQSCFNNGLRIYLIYTHAPVLWFAYSLLLNEAVNAVGMVLIYRKQPVGFIKWKMRLGYAKEMLRDSWPLVISGFVLIFYMRIDQIMIKHMLGNEAVGIYSVAVRFSDLWAFLPGTIGSALYPTILNARKLGNEFYLKKMQLLFDIMMWVTVGVIIPATFLFGDWAIVNWYGIAYAEAGTILMIYVCSSIFGYTGSALYYWLLTENMQKYAIYRSLIGAVMNIVLNLVFIPMMGIKGAAVATLISEAFAGYFSSLLTRDTWPGFRMQTKALLLYSAFAAAAGFVRGLRSVRTREELVQ